ncbi:MAG: carboxypeptidase-like regulatory domain-containing protein, partial [Terriglobia bacterium]
MLLGVATRIAARRFVFSNTYCDASAGELEAKSMSITSQRGSTEQTGPRGSIRIASSCTRIDLRAEDEERDIAWASARSAGIAIMTSVVFAASLWAAASGSISGTLKDPSGAVIPSAVVTLMNTTLQSAFHATSDSEGFYSFPVLPVGHYDLTIKAPGFETQKRTNLAVDTESALTVDVTLKLGKQSETVTVAATEATTEAQVDTVATHLGELVTGAQMTALPLNGRSYTDLLSIQPGVVPVTTLQQNSVIMAGVTGALAPSGDLNPGNLSIDGQRESSNGFMVNGIDVQEHMNGGTS